MNKIKERPILFSGPMVRALLAGTKTQTRRIVKDIKIKAGWGPGRVTFCLDKGPKRYHYGSNVPISELADPFLGIGALCPYGQPGDRLWVREKWRVVGWNYNQSTIKIEFADGVKWTLANLDEESFERYIAQSKSQGKVIGTDGYAVRVEGTKWRPSLFMLREASRLLLEIVSVRVERLQDISEADAVAEGIATLPYFTDRYQLYGEAADSITPWAWEAKESYRTLWNLINGLHGPGSWQANPYVWVVEFKRIEADGKPVSRVPVAGAALAASGWRRGMVPADGFYFVRGFAEDKPVYLWRVVASDYPGEEVEDSMTWGFDAADDPEAIDLEGLSLDTIEWKQASRGCVNALDCGNDGACQCAAARKRKEAGRG